MKKIQSQPNVPTTKRVNSTNEESKIEWPRSATTITRSSTDSMHQTVPPATPDARFSFAHVIAPIPKPFPKMEDLQLPYVREVGIKASIDILSDHFSCSDYKLNPLQFWFLDVVADCIWKMQDEFQFPETYQKVILEWILFVFDLIRDPNRNLSRKEFFKVFKEALAIAEEQIQAGSDLLPVPSDLFSWEQSERDEVISFPESEQSSTISATATGESFIAVGIDENVEVYKLPKITETLCTKDIFTDSSMAGAEEAKLEEESLRGCEESSEDFYQPDANTPQRFLSSSSSSSALTEENDELTPPSESKFLWKRSSLSSAVCSSETLLESNESSSESSKENVLEEWQRYVTDASKNNREMEKKMVINKFALTAIKDFVYDYFYETFQFTIIKLSLITKFTTITETINTEWNIPKVLKAELKRPKEGKPKKAKKGKAKKPKSPRKKTKAKKGKKKKPKQSKKSKKPKKEKKKKPTKEEKAEMARLKREQEKREEEMRRMEENRRLLFPLKEALDDEFFKSIFDHWVKPKREKGKKGKGKKGRGKK